MRNLLILLLASAALAAPAKTIDGTFTGIEQGDYAHLNLKDAKGTEHSFFVITGDKSFKPYLEHPEAHKNQKVRVHYQHVKKNIPEAGGEMEIDEALSIEPLK